MDIYEHQRSTDDCSPTPRTEPEDKNEERGSIPSRDELFTPTSFGGFSFRSGIEPATPVGWREPSPYESQTQPHFLQSPTNHEAQFWRQGIYQRQQEMARQSWNSGHGGSCHSSIFSRNSPNWTFRTAWTPRPVTNGQKLINGIMQPDSYYYPNHNKEPDRFEKMRKCKKKVKELLKKHKLEKS